MKINKKDGSVENIKNIHDVSWGENFAIICMEDLKTRFVRPLAEIESYEIKGQPTLSKKK